MKTKFIEAITLGPNGEPFNHGKFMVGRYDEEWSRRSAITEAGASPLLRQIGWGPAHLFVMDLQTGEGFTCLPGGHPDFDRKKHNVWTCVIFPVWLRWLYDQDLSDLDALPNLVTFSFDQIPPALVGSRGDGQPVKGDTGVRDEFDEIHAQSSST